MEGIIKQVPGEPECKEVQFLKKNWNICNYCDGGMVLAIGNTNDRGIAIQYPNRLVAYGYDVHGTGSNGLSVTINYCPMCGKQLPNRK